MERERAMNLTDEELYLLCEQWEEEMRWKKLEEMRQKEAADKGIDWDWESFIFEKWNPRNFK
jgi:hypothetical protein